MQQEGHFGEVCGDDSRDANVRGDVEDACSTHAESILLVSLYLSFLIEGSGKEPVIRIGRGH
jgi:hypothetical protein